MFISTGTRILAANEIRVGDRIEWFPFGARQVHMVTAETLPLMRSLVHPDVTLNRV